nr:MAG TPA: hypothetical protein [Caudoviricetes sp.]
MTGFSNSSHLRRSCNSLTRAAISFESASMMIFTPLTSFPAPPRQGRGVMFGRSLERPSR